MVTKKKLEYGELHGWHWFIPLFVMPCVLLFVLFSSNSYAMTSDEIDNFMADYFDFLSTKNQSASTEFENYYNNKKSDILNYINDKDKIIASYYSGNYFIYLINTEYNFYIQNNIMLSTKYTSNMNRGKYTWLVLQNNNIANVVDSDTPKGTFFNISNHIFSSNFNIYNDSSLQNLYINANYEFIESVISNSITLTSTSLPKFSYSDFNQCVVTTIGDWSYDDFVYSVERLISNEWVEFVPPHENYVIYGYENPWYITWHDINYWPVGTYHYVADYNSLGEDLYYSEPFNITGNVVENTGTIDDGNLTIDTGQTIDDIKDFMGSPADFNNANITQNDIENALNLEETVNPYDNFVLSLINGLTSSLTGNTSTSWTFKVHTWGETFTFYPSDVIPPYSQGLHDFLAIISTTFVVIIIVKWITQIVESVNVGDVSKSLELIEEKYSDLL